jgi:predicted GIY-YIG superfamily endonuclease
MFAVAKIVNMNWTKEKCISVAKKCKSRSDFKKSFSGAWDSAWKNDWLNEVYKYLKNPDNMSIKWTKEKCKSICNNYNSLGDFRKKEPKVYDAVLNKKWLNELCSHMIRKLKPNGYWTKEKCLEESLKYNTKTNWIKHSISSYSAAHRNNWIDYCSSHMIKLGTNQNRVIYSFEFEDNHVYVGLTYSPENRKKYHLTNKDSTVYKYILKTNLIPEFKIVTTFIKKETASIREGEILNKYLKNNWIPLNKNKTGGLGGDFLIWNEKKCLEAAKKCKTRAEFKKMRGGAYRSARRNGWLNKCCAHMTYEQLPNGYWKNDKNRCIEEAKKYDKIYHFRINAGGAYNAVVENRWYNDFKKIYNEK